MPNKNIPPRYFNVVYHQKGKVAKLYLYGYIGQEKWWSDDPTEELTDLAIVKAINALGDEVERIDVHINSNGGDVFQGEAIINALRACGKELHGYVDGVAASMAAQILMAMPNRHMSSNSKIMLHASGMYCFGNANYLRKQADILEKLDSGFAESLATATGMDLEKAKAYYAGEDNWLTAAECQALGLVAQLDDASTTEPAPAEGATAQLRLGRIAASAGEKEEQGFLQKLFADIRDFLNPTASRPDLEEDTDSDPDATTPDAMNIEEIEKAIAAGTLDREALLAALQPAAAAPAEPAAVAVNPEIEALKASLATMQAQLAKLGAEPGAGATRVAASNIQLDGQEKTELDVFNETVAKAAASNDSVFFSL